MTSISELKKRFMSDPDFRKEYAEADGVYSVIEALSRAGQDSSLSKAEPMHARSPGDA